MTNLACPFCGGNAHATEEPQKGINVLSYLAADFAFQVAFGLCLLLGLWYWAAGLGAMIVVSLLLWHRWRLKDSTYRCNQCHTLLAGSEVKERRRSEV